MLKTLGDVLAMLGTIDMWIYIVVGTTIGVIFGLIPGLNSLVALSLFLPFVFAMQPISGVAFLLSMGSTTTNAGGVTAALIGIPGTDNNIASMADSHAITKRGEAKKALGLQLMSSMLGGVVGGLVLLAVIPIMAPLVMAFASPECLMLVLVGVVFIALLSEDKLKGLIVGFVGFMISFIGMSPVTGEVRFTFGVIRLMDGVQVVPIALGLFAIPGIVKMYCDKPKSQKTEDHVEVPYESVTARLVAKEGIAGILRHKLLFIRSCLMGVFFGFVPALGGPSTAFLTYGIAKQTSKHPEEFGKGSEEGVISVESMLCAKDAGGLIPVLAFGIPGTLMTALIMSSFVVLGIIPGPTMFRDNLDIVFLLPVIMVICNVLASGSLIFVSRFLVKITQIKTAFLPPILTVTCVCGAYLIRGAWIDVIVFILFGIIGTAMVAFNFSRAPFVLAAILGKVTERYLFLTTRAYGWSFLTRPIVMGILIIIVVGFAILRTRKILKARKARAIKQ